MDDDLSASSDCSGSIFEEWRPAYRELILQDRIARNGSQDALEMDLASIRDLYHKVVESVIKLYKEDRSNGASWDHFRKAADRLAEMHKLMKFIVARIYSVGTDEGALNYSTYLLSKLKTLSKTADGQCNREDIPLEFLYQQLSRPNDPQRSVRARPRRRARRLQVRTTRLNSVYACPRGQSCLVDLSSSDEEPITVPLKNMSEDEESSDAEETGWRPFKRSRLSSDNIDTCSSCTSLSSTSSSCSCDGCQYSGSNIVAESYSGGEPENNSDEGAWSDPSQPPSVLRSFIPSRGWDDSIQSQDVAESEEKEVSK